MASFAMHYIVGERFLDKCSDKITFFDKNGFRLGNLVVDSLGISNYSRDEKLKRKMITHFRNEEDNDKCIQIPNVDKFFNKYKELIESDYTVMGYLFHLYTDKIFFEYLYSRVIEVLDKNMKKTNYKKDGFYVRVLKNNKIFNINDFYSGNSIGGLYRDYSKMNKYLINKYNISFNYDELLDYSLNNFVNSGVEEINYSNVREVIDKMKDIFLQAMSDSDDRLDVFRVEDIDDFILRVVDGFGIKYEDSIKKLIKR